MWVAPGEPNRVRLNVYTEVLEDCEIPGKGSSACNRAAYDTVLLMACKGKNIKIDKKDGGVSNDSAGAGTALLRLEFIEV